MKYIILASFLINLAGSLVFALHFYGFINLDPATSEKLAVALVAGICFGYVCMYSILRTIGKRLGDTRKKLESFYITMS